MIPAPALLPLIDERRRVDRRKGGAEQSLAAKAALLEAARLLRCRQQHKAADLVIDHLGELLVRARRQS